MDFAFWPERSRDDAIAAMTHRLVTNTGQSAWFSSAHFVLTFLLESFREDALPASPTHPVSGRRERK